MSSVVKAVKKVAKATVSAATNVVKSVVNPVKAVKNLVSDPMGFVAKTTGMDVLFGKSGSTAQPTEGYAGTTQAERAQQKTQQEQTPAERSRMLSRQGMQGANPTMLMGQDLEKSYLSEDAELGGTGQ